MWRPMSEAKKDSRPILAAFRLDLVEHTKRADLDGLAGRQVVIRHPGLADDGFDMGWNLAGPFGNGGYDDDWFAGWQPLQEHPQECEENDSGGDVGDQCPECRAQIIAMWSGVKCSVCPWSFCR